MRLALYSFIIIVDSNFFVTVTIVTIEWPYSEHILKISVFRWGHCFVETRTQCSLVRRSWSTPNPSWATPRRALASSSLSMSSLNSLALRERLSCRYFWGNHNFLQILQNCQNYASNVKILSSRLVAPPCLLVDLPIYTQGLASSTVLVFLGSYKLCIHIL